MLKDARKKPQVVVLGGGNGTSRLLRALLPLLRWKKIASLHALVHMSDDGGSTGRLREQYHVASIGDLTRCLVALSVLQGDVRGDEFLRALEYRFTAGDFAGHSLRHVFLAALELTSDIDTAIATMARVLQVPKYAGVVPTTLTTLTQQVSISFDGRQNLLGTGQHSIAHKVNMQADPRWQPGAVVVTFVEGDVALNPRAKEILEQATHIIVAPGHTYGTILPTLALPALGRVVSQSQAKLYAVMTLLTTPRQTIGWTGEDFVRVYESYVGRRVDVVIGNNTKLAEIPLVDGQDWVMFPDHDHPYQLIQDNVVSTEVPGKQSADVVPRAIVVHDAKVMGTILSKLILAG